MKSEIKERIEKIRKGEVPEGYHKTKVGIVPIDWRVKSTSEIADVKGGKRLPKGNSLVDYNTKHPYITVSDMYSGSVDTTNIKFVPEEIAPVIKRYTISIDDIFISVAGTLGLVGIIPKELDGANLTENADKLTSLKINQQYLKYVYMSSIIQKEIEKERTTNAQPKLAIERIKKFQVPVPIDSEQQKIANILSTWDKAIELKEKLIVAKKEQKRGLMQALLSGKKRLKGFRGEWKEVRIKDIAKIYLGLTYTPSYMSEGVPFLSVKDINGGKINFKDVKYISNDEFQNSTSNAKPQRGDILFGRVGTLGNPIIITQDIEFCIFVSLGFLRVLNDSISNYYIKYWMDSYFFKKQVESKIAGSSQKNLNTGWLKEFELKLPSIEEQKSIVRILSEADKEIELLEQELEIIKQQKKGLMQLLLTGIVRVNEL